jgi:hypothetical protein
MVYQMSGNVWNSHGIPRLWLAVVGSILNTKLILQIRIENVTEQMKLPFKPYVVCYNIGIVGSLLYFNLFTVRFTTFLTSDRF